MLFENDRPTKHNKCIVRIAFYVRPAPAAVSEDLCSCAHTIKSRPTQYNNHRRRG